MKPKLLPSNPQVSNNFVDYSQSTITRYYTLGSSRYYFTLHPEHNPDQGALVSTGRYFAVFLTPKGIKAFYLAPDETGIYLIDCDVEYDTSPKQKQKKRNGFTSEFANALQKEIAEQVNELRDYTKMLNKAVKEFKANR